MRHAFALAAALAVSACGSIEPVQPWEKGTLALPAMTFESGALESKAAEGVYTSREAAAGGAAVGGGGCGCN